MTITTKIKSALMNAEINYLYQLDSYKNACPNGTNFCYETVSSRAATAYASLYQAEAVYQALQDFVTPTKDNTEEKTRAIIEKYNNAETGEEMNAAEKEYFSLWSIR